MKKTFILLYIILFVLQCERGWLRKIADSNYHGCTDNSACNFNDLSYEDDGSCITPQGCNNWCPGDDVNNILELDCAGICGGSSELDECGVCEGQGIPVGECDCAGNVYDECCVCGGSGLPVGACDCAGNIEDQYIDGICYWNDAENYATVQIGGQIWISENLKVTQFKNRDEINSEYTWCNGLSNSQYIVYNDNPSIYTTYGNLYNWYAVNDSRGICPEGFHVPTNAEWRILIDYLGGKGVAGGKIKEAGNEHWNSPNTGATNESNFTALPGGFFMHLNNSFNDLGALAYFWTSTSTGETKASNWIVGYNLELVQESETYKTNGLSVRCIKDD